MQWDDLKLMVLYYLMSYRWLRWVALAAFIFGCHWALTYIGV